MKLLLAEHISSAFRTLKMNRIRSFLTTLGVAIGVASITTILLLSDGARQAVSDQVTKVGDGIALIRPGVERPSTTESLLSPVTTEKFTVSNITETDIDALATVDASVAIAPIMKLDVAVRVGDSTQQGVPLIATTPALAKTTDLAIEGDGQFIDNATSNQTAVVGAQAAIDIFGTENPVGQTFLVRDQRFTVIGILKQQNNPVNYNSVDFDTAVVVNLAAGKLLNQGHVQIQQINIHAHSAQKLAAVLPKLEKKLTEQHGGEKDFTVKSGGDIATPTNNLFHLMTGVMTAIAAISLVVGGIGIMNIMLVNVAERTREIGIRKSVGASNASIATQFMVESLIVSVLGGVIGYLAGCAIAFVAGTLLLFTPSFNVYILGVALGVSVATGLIFGLYPALRAAQKDPIESLRQYR